MSRLCPALMAAAALAIGAPARAATHVLVVTGAAGDEQDAAQFAGWASAIAAAATAHGVPAANVVQLDGGAQAVTRATRENVVRAFQDLARRTAADDEVIVVLIGHGTFDGTTALFNLPGPDLGASDFAKLLAAIPSQHVGFVDTTGASGAFLAPLNGPGRAIVTATATGGERNDARFPQYFVEALSAADADRDHDGRVSLLEAFEYARDRVADAYKKAGLLQTEHATLEDGSGGSFAATLAFGSGTAATAAASADPAVQALEAERRQLEQKIAALKQQKGSMDAREYGARLERLLVDLAKTTRAIRARQGKS